MKTATCAGRAILIVRIGSHVESPEESLHITDVLAQLISRLGRTLVRQFADLANDISVSFVIRQPPMIDLWQFPDAGESHSKRRGDDVSSEIKWD